MIETESPFGEDTHTTGFPKLTKKSGGIEIVTHSDVNDALREYYEHGDPEQGGGKPKAKKKKQTDHNDRTRDYWESDGYQCDRVDGWKSAGARFVKKDFQGLWDQMATGPDKTPVLIQICALGGVMDHLKKMCSKEEAENKRPRVDNLRHMLRSGFRCVIHAWDQPNGPGKAWVPKVIEISEGLIDEYLSCPSGKRKPGVDEMLASVARKMDMNVVLKEPFSEPIDREKLRRLSASFDDMARRNNKEGHGSN